MRAKEALVQPSSDYYVYQSSAAAARIYLYPLATGLFTYDPGYYLRRNSYDSFLLMHIRSGKCRIHVNGMDYCANKDDIVLLDCYQPHEYGNAGSEPLEVAWIHFDGVLARNYYDLIVANSGNIMSTANISEIAQNLNKILNLFRNSAPIRESYVSEKLTSILNNLLNAHREQTRELRTKANPIEDSMSYINEHFNEPLTLEMIAQNANLSPYYFTRLFTAETGYTPHQYLIAARINSAKFLLQTPGLSIKEIAFNCGFNSESSFCSTFRKWVHETPSEFRTRSGVQ